MSWLKKCQRESYTWTVEWEEKVTANQIAPGNKCLRVRGHILKSVHKIIHCSRESATMKLHSGQNHQTLGHCRQKRTDKQGSGYILKTQN